MISHSLVCETNMATVSWRKEDVALGYVINATSVMGHRKECNGNRTFCDFPELQCGKMYTVQGVSLGKECNSEPSSELTIVTGISLVWMEGCVYGIQKTLDQSWAILSRKGRWLCRLSLQLPTY